MTLTNNPVTGYSLCHKSEHSLPKKNGGRPENISKYWLKAVADSRYFCALKYP
ncbi:MAG: hypothetical protein IKO06_03265 [Alphaproteobacteria bacterium]|nr:hypothetical protein [Alphaproteobacteria bacterium]